MTTPTERAAQPQSRGEHTPGPWSVEQWAGNTVGFTIRNISRGVIARTVKLPPKSHYGETEIRANARLIAAAPELLAACKALLEATWDIHIPGHPTLGTAQGLCQAAIAKTQQ